MLAKIKTLTVALLHVSIGLSGIAATVVVLKATPGLNGTDAAGWVQAVGSIAAIVGSVWVVHRQHELQQRAESQRSAEEEAQRFMAVKALLARILATTRQLEQQRNHAEFYVAKDDTIHMLAKAARILASIAPMELPHADLIIHAQSIEDAVPLVVQGLRQERQFLSSPLRYPESKRVENDGLLRDLADMVVEPLNLCVAEIASRGALHSITDDPK